MVLQHRPAQDVGQQVHRQHRGAGAVAGLPVRHPGQLDRERVGQPGQVDAPLAVLGDRLPVRDARADDRTAPLGRQLLPEPLDRVETARPGAGDRAAHPLIAAPASRPRRTSSSPRRAAPRPRRPSRRGPAWSARGRDPSRRDTTHSGVPASSSAVAWLCRNQCGVHPGGPMPSRRSAAVLSRTVPSRSGASSGGRCRFTSSGGVCGQRDPELVGTAGQVGQVVGEQPLQVGADVDPPRAHHLHPGPVRRCPGAARSRHTGCRRGPSRSR